MKILVITISDRASRGEYEDLSGPAVKTILEGEIAGADVEVVVVPDEEEDILRALESGLGFAAVITTGGTGLGPRDITPEVTERFCDRSAPQGRVPKGDPECRPFSGIFRDEVQDVLCQYPWFSTWSFLLRQAARTPSHPCCRNDKRRGALILRKRFSIELTARVWYKIR